MDTNLIFLQKTVYDATSTTCGELKDMLIDTGGNHTAVLPGWLLVEDKDSQPAELKWSWRWIQSQKNDKEVYLLKFVSRAQTWL